MRVHPSLISELDSRSILLGKTGSGKSTLARVLLENCYLQTWESHGGRQQVIIDSKADFRLPDVVATHKRLEVCCTPGDAVSAINAGDHVLYRPLPDYSEVEDYDPVYRACFWRGDLELYTDEIKMTCRDGSHYARYQGAIYQQGRARMIRAIGGTQRPSSIPVVTVSETEYTYIFLLRWQDDLERVQKMIGSRNWPDRHAYWFLGPDGPATLHVLRFGQVATIAA